MKLQQQFPSLHKARATSLRNDISTIASIGNQSKLSLPQIKSQTIHKRNQWVYQEDYEFMRDSNNFFKMVDEDASPQVNKRTLAIKQLQLMDADSISDIEERFSIVLKFLKQTKIGNLYNISVLIYGIVLAKHFQYEKAIIVWQRYLVFCNLHRAFKFKIIAYKHLSELCLNQRDYVRALNYSKKLLKYSLYYDENNQELNTYEQIGKIFYYMKQPQIAKEFHEKFMDGKSLPINDKIRQAAKRMLDFEIKQKQQLGRIDTESDDEFDIDKVVEPKELMNNPVRLREVLLHQHHLWPHVRKMSEALGPSNDRIFNNQKLYQKDYYTQLSNNSSVKNFLLNNTTFTQKTNSRRIIDKLIIDIQQQQF